MKKIKLSLSLILIGMSLGSCKKIYQCECTWDGGSSGSNTTTLQTKTKETKKEATAWCNESEAALSYANGTCTLK